MTDGGGTEYAERSGVRYTTPVRLRTSCAIVDRQQSVGLFQCEKNGCTLARIDPV